MSSEREDRAAESAVNDSYGTTIPAEIRAALDEEIRPGDTVRWTLTDGELSVEIQRERYGALAELEPLDGPEWDGETEAESAYSE